MKRKRVISGVIYLFLFFNSFSIILSAQMTAAEELNLGVQAFRNSKLDEAAQHFQRCTVLDPDNSLAHLYLATTYLQQYIPGVETRENTDLAEHAIEQYQGVLHGEPTATAKINSTKGIGYLYLQMKRSDDAKQYYHMAADLDLDDPENYYSLGVIDWTLTYVPRQEARAKLGVKPEESLQKKSPSVCAEIREKNARNVQEGIDNLNKAIQLRPDYDDAMAYLNLMYREKADIECDDPAARENDLRTADDWVDKTMAVKKVKANKAAGAASPSVASPR
jgi:tetratricopeptide (TPR) repeat protein